MTRLRWFVAIAALALVAGACGPVPPFHPGHPGPPDTKLRIGAASRSVLPLVNGRQDYLRTPLPSRTDATDPGVLVPKWDDGRVAVGNGDSVSYWVHDDLRATAMAVEDTRTGKIVVLVSSDLYMIFRNDADGIRRKAAQLVSPGDAARMTVVVTATHNHEGPDTAFDVNHSWYEHMTDQLAAAVADAVHRRTPATLSVASGQHWFGATETTDPRIYDPTLQVLQARDRHHKVIATAVQWNDHPETTLGYAPPASTIAADCNALGLAGDDCTADGRYFTSDYPGILREDLQARYGGEVLYFNGAVGVLTTPLGAQVWEVTKQAPLGNQLQAPPGAVAAGGGTDYTAKNFRRAVVIGDQLNAAVVRLLGHAQPLRDTRVSYAIQPFWTRLTNFGFRVLLVVDPATGRSQLGHDPGPLYVCPDAPANYATCVSDNGASAHDDTVDVDYRVGDHFKSAVEYVHIGPVGMMFLPGEVASELVMGLPATFRTHPERWYVEPAGTHAFGPALTTPGFVHQRMHDPYEWTIGLGSDELGYIMPISNFRVKCVVDEFLPGACANLYATGAIEFPDAVAATTCKRVTEDPNALAGKDALTAFGITASCEYGQALGEANGHYEETNSAGWDLAADMLQAVGALTHDTDPTQVNPAFPGYWAGYLPPGNLP
jgi:hypothetical protein